MIKKSLFIALFCGFITGLLGQDNYYVGEYLSDQEVANKQKSRIDTKISKITPEIYSPACRNQIPFFISCDFLYWKAQNTGWLYGILVSGNGKESSSTNERESKDTKEIYISSTQSIQQKLLRGDFNFDFGSRLGFGYKFLTTGNDLSCNWTYYHNKLQEEISVSNIYQQVVVTPLNFQNQAQDVEAKWKLNYNVIDFDVGHSFGIKRDFSVKLFGGIRGAWLYQNFKTSYVNFYEERATAGTILTEFDNAAVHFWGAGLNGGVYSYWNMGSGFSLFNTLSASLLYGNVYLDQESKIYVLQKDGTFEENITEFQDDYYEFKPAFQMVLGIGWETCFNKSKNYFKFNAGWEINYWWDQCPLIYSVFSLNKPLMLNGLTVSAIVEF